jgi:hypothetical protein
MLTLCRSLLKVAIDLWIVSAVFVIRNARKMSDYGKQISWPAAPSVLVGYVEKFKRAHLRRVLLLDVRCCFLVLHLFCFEFRCCADSL